MATGSDLVSVAAEHVGERYVFGTFVPKDNPNWRGPWDCAEFTTWIVYTSTGQLYGVADADGPLSAADAWTGFWLADVEKRGRRVSIAEAATLPGAFLLRHSSSAGHIVVSDGTGGTIEAMSSRTGVVRGRLANRRWDMGILIPWVQYSEADIAPLAVAEPTVTIYRVRDPLMQGPTVKRIQRALSDAGFDPGPIDGFYGDLTAAAVRAYQAMRRLVADGEVGPKTAKSLGLSLETA